MYVPIIGSLSSMFRNSALCNSFQKAKPHQDSFYSEINDGSYLKNHILFSQQKHALQIQLSYDDLKKSSEEDLKKYGFDPILKPIVDDIKALEAEGMQVPFSAMPLKSRVFQVSGDNLAFHDLFGFVQSFSEIIAVDFV